MVVDTHRNSTRIKIHHNGLSFADRVKMHDIEKRFDLSLVSSDEHYKLAAVMPEFMIERFIESYELAGWAVAGEKVYQNTVHFEFYRTFAPLE